MVKLARGVDDEVTIGTRGQRQRSGVGPQGRGPGGQWHERLWLGRPQRPWDTPQCHRRGLGWGWGWGLGRGWGLICGGAEKHV